jgi:ligand-binding SRPBCC domain-containing protein
MTRIALVSTVDAPVAAVYAFHRDTRNVARISPRGTQVLRVEGDFPLVLGGEIHLDIRILPVPMVQRWHMRVAELVEPSLVVDEMISGPFSTWRHEHRFSPLDADRTRLEDVVTYTVPFGVAGRAVDWLVLRHLLRLSFRSRHRATARVLG